MKSPFEHEHDAKRMKREFLQILFFLILVGIVLAAAYFMWN